MNATPYARLPESRLTLHRSRITAYRKHCAQTLTGKILDCGGGLGDYLPYLRGDVYSLDVDFEILSLLDHDGKIVASAEELPFADDSFDGVWACAMAQYVQLEPFVDETIRVTKQGGHIWILVPNGNSPWDAMKTLFGMKGWWAQKGIRTQYTVDDLNRFGLVHGEVQFLPFESMLRQFPKIGHTLMLKIVA
ncbi:MAG: class I SAM-dependent methyltransferase [Chloroflexota bacterium]